ncbi:xylose isomerase-like protein [Coprinopsis sp. MPI-PUGE-AT-0042]|nr:xylose isomerase-like protein [Coprinopsis sp. MPI-PUGE-AT-0042]
MATRSTRSMTIKRNVTEGSALAIENVASSSTAQVDEDAGDGRPGKRMRFQQVIQRRNVPRTARTQLKTEQEDEDAEASFLSSLSPSPSPPPASKARAKRAKTTTGAGASQASVGETVSKKPKRVARKAKIDPNSLEGVEQDVVDTAGFLPRPVHGSEKAGWKVGAHVSAAGGVENAPVNAAEIGCSAFALFLKSQRKWSSPPLSPRSIALFKHRMKQLNFDPKTDVLVHGNYLVNLGNPDASKRKVSYECFLDEIRRSGQLGVTLLNIHPGSTVSLTTPANSCALIAECINEAHRETAGGVGGDVVVVLENMAGSGNVIGSTFEEIALIIKGVEDKTRVGVCFDTCHGFSAGYDFRTKAGWDGTSMRKFDEAIGLKYLKGMHLNDSKTEFGSKKDRHESIGMGSLGLTSFHHILNDQRTKGIPLVLETPSWERPKEVWGTEIGVLRKLIALPISTEPKAEDEGLVVTESVNGDEETLQSLQEEVGAAIKRVGGDQPKVKKGKGQLDGDLIAKAKAARGKVAKKVSVGKRKRALEEEEKEKEDGVQEQADESEDEGEEGGCC